MNLRCCSFSEFAMSIRSSQNRIVIFGAGVIGQVTTPEIMRIYGLLPFIECYIDNDEEKWETIISICEKRLSIHSPEYLKACKRSTVLLLNVSRFSDVLNQLEGMECTTEMDCYIMPMMCIHNFCYQKSGGKAIMSGSPLIPKKIHYMWLGKQKIPHKLQKCIDSWKRFCPDYEIIRWDENNYDIVKIPYMKEAYEAGAYGFVPDYARLDILFNNGGIYMDTDVEILRGLDSLLYQEAFCGVEKWQVLNFGGCSGAVKGHPMLKRFLDARAQISFIDKNGKKNKTTCGFYDTRVAIEHGYVIDGTTQNIGGMNIYASDYFHPYDYMSGSVQCTEHTYSVHWFNGGWLDENMRMENEEAVRRFEQIYHWSLRNQEDY